MKFIGFILLFIICISCSPFETRNPEEPSSDSDTFIPPTSPDIVISNFIQSIYNKNIENYMNCFDPASESESIYYVYVPSADAANNYSNIFFEWKINDERRYLIATFSIVPENINPVLEFNQSEFESITPDSAIYITNYKFQIPNNSDIDELFEGKMQLTLNSLDNGYWRIRRWIDSQTSDSLKTWSHLKAQMY